MKITKELLEILGAVSHKRPFVHADSKVITVLEIANDDSTAQFQQKQMWPQTDLQLSFNSSAENSSFY